MNKKLLSTVMAGTMLATSAAPVFAETKSGYTVYEGNQEKTVVKDTEENREKAYKNIIEVVEGKKFKNNGSVYALKISTSDIINFDFNNEKNIKKLKDSIYSQLVKDKTVNNIKLIDRGHVEKNGNYYHEYQEPTKVAERYKENKELESEATQQNDNIKSREYSDGVLKVITKDDITLEYRKGSKKVDFTKPLIENNKVIGFEYKYRQPITETVTFSADQKNMYQFNKEFKNNNNLKSEYVEKITFETVITKDGEVANGYYFRICLKDGYKFSDKKGKFEGRVGDTNYDNKYDIFKDSDTTDEKSPKLSYRNYVFEGRNIPNLKKPIFDSDDPNKKTIIGFEDIKKENVTYDPGAVGSEIDGEVIKEIIFDSKSTNNIVPEYNEFLPPKDNKPEGGDDSHIVIPPIKPDNKPTVKPIETIAGEDRYDTAIEVAKEIAPVKEIAENGSVVLVNGNALVDGLAAAPLASSVSTTNKVKAAPILLTKTDKLTTSTKDYIEELVSQKKSLGAGKLRVYIVGGEAVVSKNVEKELSDLGVEIIRAGGKNREETSLKVADLMSEKQKSSNAFVVGADGEADAMSIASIAASRKEPIIVSRKGGLSKSAIEKMASLKNTSATIIGGDKVVSANTEKSLKEANINSDRVAGVNRQDTNAKIINRYASSRLDKVLVSKDGQNKKDELVDALTATSLAVKYNAPIVLATNKISDAQIKAIKDNADTKGISISKVGYGIAESVINTIAEKVGLIK